MAAKLVASPKEVKFMSPETWQSCDYSLRAANNFMARSYKVMQLLPHLLEPMWDLSIPWGHPAGDATSRLSSGQVPAESMPLVAPLKCQTYMAEAAVLEVNPPVPAAAVPAFPFFPAVAQTGQNSVKSPLTRPVWTPDAQKPRAESRALCLTSVYLGWLVSQQ